MKKKDASLVFIHLDTDKMRVLHDLKWYENESCSVMLTLCDPMDCNLPGSSAHGIFEARILEWVAISFSRRSSQPRGRTQVSCIAGFIAV